MPTLGCVLKTRPLQRPFQDHHHVSSNVERFGASDGSRTRVRNRFPTVLTCVTWGRSPESNRRKAKAYETSRAPSSPPIRMYYGFRFSRKVFLRFSWLWPAQIQSRAAALSAR